MRNKRCGAWARVAVVLVGLLGLVAAGGSVGAANQNPWGTAQTVTPAALAKEISNPALRAQMHIVCAGFDVLYRGAHIPGAAYAGPASRPSGVAALRKWAGSIPRNADVVVYCGCCPMKDCPNIRPAFQALEAMGFTHLRVLVLPTSFAKDWVEAGLPIAHGN